MLTLRPASPGAHPRLETRSLAAPDAYTPAPTAFAPAPPAWAPSANPTGFMPFDSVGNAADGTFSGYASLFDTPDMGNDIIAPGAFTESLARRGARGIKLLFYHDAAQPIGVWQTIREDARGLFVEGKLTLDNSKARDILALLRSGALDGLSIGFRAVTANRSSKGGLRRLTKIDLWEISIVTFPMLTGARVATVKSRPRASTAHLPLAQRIRSLTAAIRANT